MNRRRLLGLVTVVAATPLLRPFLLVARAAAPRDFRFRALHRGSPVGEHRVAFRPDGERLAVATHIDITPSASGLASAPCRTGSKAAAIPRGWPGSSWP
jgi:hypothetical protein